MKTPMRDCTRLSKAVQWLRVTLPDHRLASSNRGSVFEKPSPSHTLKGQHRISSETMLYEGGEGFTKLTRVTRGTRIYKANKAVQGLTRIYPRKSSRPSCEVRWPRVTFPDHR